jgi:hypothetical protein
MPEAQNSRSAQYLDLRQICIRPASDPAIIYLFQVVCCITNTARPGPVRTEAFLINHNAGGLVALFKTRFAS